MILLLAFFLNACNESTTESPTHAVEDSTPVWRDTVHTTRNAVDWMGAYEGSLEINGKRSKIYIALNKEGNWIARQGKEEQTGKFEWMENGSVIQLKGIRSMPDKYFVGENFIMQLEKDGQLISDDLDGIYTLNKIN